MMNLINIIFILMSTLLSIAFFTLMERKMISYSQTRKGPNKVYSMGILQPISDAIKLMGKEINMNLKCNFSIYMISPISNILCSMMMWMTLPFFYTFMFMKMSLMFLVSCMTFNTILIMMMSWSSNSNYSMIGMMRTIAQTISYEVNFMMIILTIINMTEQMNLNFMKKMQKYIPMMIMMNILFLMWLIIILAETNRTPFDFSEGESELISGFNIEFSSKSFMMIFLAEYSSILMMSMMTVMMFMSDLKTMKFNLMYLLMCNFFIWTRTTLPRFRYDKLMKLNWKQILPSVTIIFMISFLMKTYYTKKIINKISEENFY
uniref:NADH-ubiquinone oxidoreductase chain 1 n=1 Tax=Dialeurodes hongkongensis TaxID=267826 RepID=Q6JCR0_9HEMI|nr:NADH dehydrogenase subunit 1 [Dialeurodes hongkongensis]